MRINVVGAGITGLFSAYYLLKDGHSVSIIDRSPSASDTSIYNGGLLTPSLTPTPNISLGKIFSTYLGKQEPLYISPIEILKNLGWFRIGLRKGRTGYENQIMKLATESVVLYRQFFDEENIHPDVISGVAALYREEKDARRTASTLGGKYLEETEIKALGFRGLGGGVIFEDEVSINPPRLFESLLDKVRKLGGELILGRKASIKIGERDQSDAEMFIEDERIPADAIVVSGGSWTSELLKPLGFDPMILPARGLAMLFDTSGVDIVQAPALLEDYGIAIAQHNKSVLRVTSFFEMVEFNKEFKAARKKWLLQKIGDHLTNANLLRSYEEGVGFRPCTPDQIPVIGKIPKCRNVYVASGSCRLGVTLAPAVSHMIKSMMSGQELGTVSRWCSPERFAL